MADLGLAGEGLSHEPLAIGSVERNALASETSAELELDPFRLWFARC